MESHQSDRKWIVTEQYCYERPDMNLYGQSMKDGDVKNKLDKTDQTDDRFVVTQALRCRSATATRDQFKSEE